MAFFKIRSARIQVEIPIHIFLQDRGTGILSTDYSCATIINISLNGACVTLDKMILNGKHLFFTTQEQAANHLFLRFSEADVPFDISAKSIWMDGVSSEGKQYFKIGMRFTEQQKELFFQCKKISTS